jgi:hypothetical protein
MYNILSKPVLGGMDDDLHFQVLSMNRLNQTDPTIYSLLLFSAFFKDSMFMLPRSI